MFEKDAVAFLDALALDEFLAGLPDHADVFVTHDHVLDRLFVILHVRAADAGDFHFQDGAVFRDIRHVEFAKFGYFRAGFYSG